MAECEYRHCRAALSGDDDIPCIDWKLGKCSNAKCPNRHPNVTPKLKAQWATERPILAAVTPVTKTTVAPKKKVKSDSDFIVKSLEEILKEQKIPITPVKNTAKGSPTVRKTIRKPRNANSTAPTVQTAATPTAIVPSNSNNSSINIPNTNSLVNNSNNETGSPVSSPPLLSPTSSSVSSPPPSPPREERTINSTPSTATNNTNLSPKRGREESDDSDVDVDESPKAKRQKVDTLTNITEHQHTEHREIHEPTVAAPTASMVIEPTIQEEEEEESDEEEEDEKMGNEKIGNEYAMDEETFRIEYENELLQFRRIYGTSV